MRRLLSPTIALALSGFLASCASAVVPAPAPPPPAVVAPPAPRCAPGVAREPKDARVRMGTLGDDVRRCFLVGRASDDGDKIVVEVAIGEDGGVRDAKVVTAPPGKASASSCAEQALRKASFATFCGDDVAVRWTYALQAR